LINIESQLTEDDKISLNLYENYMVELNILGLSDCPRNLFRKFIEKVFDESLFSMKNGNNEIEKHTRVKFYDIFMRNTRSPIDMNNLEEYLEEEKIDTIMEELGLFNEDL
jgi:hypothetical protein